MDPDPILDEIRRIREQIAAEFNYDVKAIGADARARDAAGERLIIRGQPRPPVVSNNLPAKTA